MKLNSPVFKFPKEDALKNAIASFSLTQRVIFWFLVFLLALSSILLSLGVSNSLMAEVPARGGKINEGIIGSARFINPLLSISDADRDLSSLVYSGLLRVTPEGELIPDLAESYAISDDGLTYDFILKKNARFHDGSPVTTDDVEFTIAKAQDPTLKSPRRASWDGVSVEKVNDREIKFILKQPYGPFLSNTILGILPKKLWKNVGTDEFTFSSFNISPIGSGPYRISDIKKNPSGLPNEFKLEAFKKYALGGPFISNINIKFYSSESDLVSALKSGEIENANISAESAVTFEKANFKVMKVPLPRIFAVFFNQNQANIFAEKAVRQALNTALNKKEIIDGALLGYGKIISSPLPGADIISTTTIQGGTEKAMEILNKAGWKISSTTSVMEKKTKAGTQKLTFTLSTSEAPELKTAAQKIISQWQKIGAEVSLAIYETGDLNQNIIRPRKYDALFFGEIVGRDKDLYPFWHSSQRNDPGLNVAMYVNNKANKLLEEARATAIDSVRDEKYKGFLKEIAADMPAAFIYSPDFLYVIDEDIKGVNLGSISIPADRFAGVKDWYIETNKIWKIFLGNQSR